MAADAVDTRHVLVVPPHPHDAGDDTSLDDRGDPAIGVVEERGVQALPFLFLLSDSSSWISGEAIDIDAGSLAG